MASSCSMQRDSSGERYVYNGEVVSKSTYDLNCNLSHGMSSNGLAALDTINSISNMQRGRPPRLKINFNSGSICSILDNESIYPLNRWPGGNACLTRPDRKSMIRNCV